MRNITQATPTDNSPRRLRPARRPQGPLAARALATRLLALALVALLAPAGGCGKRSGQGASGQGSGEAATPPAASNEAAPAASAAGAIPVPGCALAVDLRGIEAFDALAAREARREPVGDDAYKALCAGPVYGDYLKTVSDALFNPLILHNVTRYVYAGVGLPVNKGAKDAAPGATRPPKRQDLVDNFTYARDHASQVKGILDGIRTGGGCRVLALLDGYLPAGRVPAALTIAFVQAGPDIRYRPGQMLVDVGVAAAAGEDQLVRLLAANLYRGLESPAADAQTAVGTGRAALAATVVKLQRQAVAAWLEGYPSVRFDAAHPQLGKADPARADAARNAARALHGIDEMAAALLNDPSQMEQKGSAVDDLLRGNGAYAPTGYMMAALIATRLGEDRWRAAAAGSPADFLRAYQEAAALKTAKPSATAFSNGLQPPSAADLASMPAFTDRTFKGLIAVVSPGAA